MKFLLVLGWVGLLNSPVIAQVSGVAPDTSVNNIKLGDRASTERVLGGAKVWEKHFEAGSILPRIEVVNRDTTQVLRLLFHYGGSKNSVDEFELRTIDKTYRLPAKTIKLEVSTFVTSRKISLGMRRDSVLKAIGDKFKVLSNKGGVEEIIFELDETSPLVIRHNEAAYYIRCRFKNGKLDRYSFGFEAV